MAADSWSDPLLEKEELWNAATRAIWGGEGLAKVGCPICSTFLRFFFAGVPGSRGGYWQWCHSCRAFSHGSGRVPLWWRVPESTIPSLDVEPEWLDENWDSLLLGR
jgi:hypothetical protein